MNQLENQLRAMPFMGYQMFFFLEFFLFFFACVCLSRSCDVEGRCYLSCQFMQFHNGLARVLYFCLPACQLNLDDRLPTTIPLIFWRYSASHVNPSFAIYGSSFLSRLPFARIAKWKRAKTRPALPTELTNSNEQGKENKKMTSFFVSTSREGGGDSWVIQFCRVIVWLWAGPNIEWPSSFFCSLGG